MKYKILFGFGHKDRDKEKPEEVHLALAPAPSGGVAIVVVDEHGNLADRPYVLTIRPDGRFIREKNVTDEAGFQIKNGQIVEKRERRARREARSFPLCPLHSLRREARRSMTVDRA